ncbi:MAG: hypothetical protein WA231_23320 [Methylocella sp.]
MVRCVRKQHPHVAGVFNADDAVTENGFALTVDLVIDQLGQITTRNAFVPAISERTEYVDAEAAYAAAFRIDEANLLDIVALGLETGEEPHPLRDVVAEAPKIDDIAGCTQTRCSFDQSWLEAVLTEPVSKRRTGNADSGNKDRLVLHCHTLALAGIILPSGEGSDHGRVLSVGECSLARADSGLVKRRHFWRHS